jgi:circadian clock protein KaiC
MRSIGIDLQQWVDRGLLEFHASRPSLHGLEMHLSRMNRAVERFRPSVVVLDPVSSLITVAAAGDVRATLTRLIDSLKMQGITAFLTSLSHGKTELERTDIEISSIVDTWLLLVTLELNGERNRGLYVLKSRGMGHSNQIREFLLTDHGVELIDVYAGPSGVVTGSGRLTQEAQEQAAVLAQEQELERKERTLARLRAAFDAEVASLRARFEAEQADLATGIDEQRSQVTRLRDDRHKIAESRGADAASSGNGRRQGDESDVGDQRSKAR